MPLSKFSPGHKHWLFFAQHGGVDADFVNHCQFIGTAAYKSSSLSDTATRSRAAYHHFPQRSTKWFEAFPNDTAFPETLVYISKWDLLDASNNIQCLRVEARMASNVNPQVIRVTSAAFCEAVGLTECMLMGTPCLRNGQSPDSE